MHGFCELLPTLLSLPRWHPKIPRELNSLGKFRRISNMSTRRFKQVDVFTTQPYRGNPVAVILDAEGLRAVNAEIIFLRIADLEFPSTDVRLGVRPPFSARAGR